MSTKLKNKIELLEKCIASMKKRDDLKTKVIGRCLHRGQIVDEVYDKQEQHEKQLAEMRLDNEILKKRIATFEQFESERVG